MLDIIYENHWVFQGILINKDKFLRAILMMKSQDGKMIIVYHNDERWKKWNSFCSKIVWKSFNIVYFLSGGIENFAKKYPEFL